jgi:membrane protein
MFDKLLSVPSDIGKFTHFLIFQIRLWPQCIKLLRKNRAGQQAAALSYHTIFGLVPLAIVMLLIFHSLHAFDDLGVQLRDFLYEQSFVKNIQYPTEPGEPNSAITIAQKIDEFTAGFYENLNKGSITIVSCAIIIWAALALLGTIEKSFNNIWHVTRGRNFIHRTTNYWTLLTLGPLFFGLAVYVNARYSITGHFHTNLFSYIGPIVPFIIAVISLFALYMLMPNAKVSSKAAIWGAVIAAIAWTVAKWAFGLYVVKLIPYSAVYGVLGLVPLGVLWIYITWLIVLFGLQLTFTMQHLKTLEEAERAAAKSHQEHFLTTDLHVMNMVFFIFKEFEKKNSPVPAELVSSHLNLPADLTENVLNHLTKSQILLKTAEPASGFAPSTIAENLTLADIADAVATASFIKPSDQPPALTQLSAEQREKFSQVTIRQAIGNLTD